MCGLVAEWFGSQTCDQQVAGSNPGRRIAECNSGQVIYTHASVTKQYNLVPANGRLCSTAGSLLPALWLQLPAGYLHCTVFEKLGFVTIQLALWKWNCSSRSGENAWHHRRLSHQRQWPYLCFQQWTLNPPGICKNATGISSGTLCSFPVWGYVYLYLA